MTRDEFGEALLRLGANLERWPRSDAEPAKRLVAGDPVAAKMLADFTAFERTIADAVRPPHFGAAEIGAVLGALDAAEATWSPTPRFWLAGAGVSALSFVAGFAVMLAMLSAQGDSGLPLSLIGLAAGQIDIGGLL